MRPWLYLDTARLGQMSPSAQCAHQDFARLAGEVGGAIQFEDLLRQGRDGCGSRFLRRFPGLAVWHGVRDLKSRLCQLAGFDVQSPTLLAARSLALMRLAARMLCRTCRNILTTDLSWPPYQALLAAHCRRRQRRLTRVSLADDVFQGRVDESQVVDRVCSAFTRHGYDGLFLTAVSSLGVRLPLDRIVHRLADQARMIVFDGAQDFCHLPPATPRNCDLYLAGCHKWLGGYHPLAFGIMGRPHWRELLERELQSNLRRPLADPMLRFTESLDQGHESGPGETVSLAALFSAAGAASDASEDSVDQFATRLSNVKRVIEVADGTGWRPCLPATGLRSGIVLLRPTQGSLPDQRPGELRRTLQRRGIVVSTYEDSPLRVSTPATRLSLQQLKVLFDGLADVSGADRSSVQVEQIVLHSSLCGG